MEAQGGGPKSGIQGEEEMELKRGPWSIEEDLVLVEFVTKHGEGRWDSLARCAGLKRTGKSCRLRWLNYLRPDVRRGNITLEEQLLILELHSRWGNRWSKIAQYLPGRTDNEIKNYWRTRVQKQAKQLRCDVNSKQFKDTMRHVWMPRLLERIQAASSSSASNKNSRSSSSSRRSMDCDVGNQDYDQYGCSQADYRNFTPDNSSSGGSSDSFGGPAQVFSPVSDMDGHSLEGSNYNTTSFPAALNSSHGGFGHGFDFSDSVQDGWAGALPSGNSWSMDDMWLLEQQLCSGI